MGGYDRRTRNTERVPSRIWSDTIPTYRKVGHSYYSNQETISYRDNPIGRPVDEQVIDPYGFISQAVAGRKQAHISDMVANERVIAGRVTKTHPHRDNGHPFQTTKRRVGTSLRGRDYSCWFGTSNSIPLRGGPVIAYGALPNLASQLEKPIPFRFTTSTNRESYSRFNAAPLPLIGPQDLSQYTAKAINAVAPGKPPVDTFAMIGELLSGFPRMMFSSFAKGDKSASSIVGDEFLNYTFGIAPTINDLVKLGKQLARISEAMLQLQRDQGNGIRRRMDFTPELTTAFYRADELSDLGHAQIGTNIGHASVTSMGERVLGTSRNTQLSMTRRKTVSFSGSFSYVVPLPPGFESKFRNYMTQLDRLIGLSPTASSGWQLTPWSWLSDWAYDLGAVLKLYERVHDDNLVINYGYLTCKVENFATQHLELAYAANRKASFSYVDTWTSSVRKERLRANPYGFIAPTSPEMNPMRWAILAALGLSRRN